MILSLSPVFTIEVYVRRRGGVVMKEVVIVVVVVVVVAAVVVPQPYSPERAMSCHIHWVHRVVCLVEASHSSSYKSSHTDKDIVVAAVSVP